MLKYLRITALSLAMVLAFSISSFSADPSPLGTFDWRNYYGGNFVTGVRAQGGQCGACWAFASTAALEAKTLITTNTPITAANPDLDLSEQVVISCDTKDWSKDGPCLGGIPATDFFVNYGIPLDACYNYQQINTKTPASCAGACANWQQNAYKIASYNPWIFCPTQDILKTALMAYGPLVVSLYAYTDFKHYIGGIYTCTPLPGEQPVSHAVLLVGFDESNSCFICKNSWSANWGEGGFFRIAYSEVTGNSEFGYAALAYNSAIPPSPQSSITSPSSGSILSGTSCTITGTATPFDVVKVEVSTDGTNWNTATDTSGNGTYATWSYTWTPVLNGSYTILSRATDSIGNVESPGAGVTVIVDKIPPMTTINYPINGDYEAAGGQCMIMGTAIPNFFGIQKVEVSIDGGGWALASDSALDGSWSEWSYTWNIPTVSYGNHTIRARATDVNGGYLVSDFFNKRRCIYA